METFISYFSMIALILVLIMLTWAIILMYEQRRRKVTSRSRLAELRKKIESLPEDSEEDKTKKEQYRRELYLEYFDNILGEIEKVHGSIAKVQAGLAKKTEARKKGK
jgi:hypothetical protein